MPVNLYYHWFNLSRYLNFSEKYKTFECITCGDKIPLHYAPSRSPTTKCNHDPTVCNTNYCFRKDCNHKHQNECDPMPCLRKYVESCTKGRGWQNIMCPHPGCGSTLSARDVEEWAPPEAFRRCVSLCWYLLQFIRYYGSDLLVEAGVRGSSIRCRDAVKEASEDTQRTGPDLQLRTNLIGLFLLTFTATTSSCCYALCQMSPISAGATKGVDMDRYI